MLTRATDIFIEELIDATYPNWQDERPRHVLAQALHGLVRQARSEQLLEIRRDAERAALAAWGVAVCRPGRKMIVFGQSGLVASAGLGSVEGGVGAFGGCLRRFGGMLNGDAG